MRLRGAGGQGVMAAAVRTPNPRMGGALGTEIFWRGVGPYYRPSVEGLVGPGISDRINSLLTLDATTAMLLQPGVPGGSLVNVIRRTDLRLSGLANTQLDQRTLRWFGVAKRMSPTRVFWPTYRRENATFTAGVPAYFINVDGSWVSRDLFGGMATGQFQRSVSGAPLSETKALVALSRAHTSGAWSERVELQVVDLNGGVGPVVDIAEGWCAGVVASSPTRAVVLYHGGQDDQAFYATVVSVDGMDIVVENTQHLVSHFPGDFEFAVPVGITLPGERVVIGVSMPGSPITMRMFWGTPTPTGFSIVAQHTFDEYHRPAYVPGAYAASFLRDLRPGTDLVPGPRLEYTQAASPQPPGIGEFAFYQDEPRPLVDQDGASVNTFAPSHHDWFDSVYGIASSGHSAFHRGSGSDIYMDPEDMPVLQVVQRIEYGAPRAQMNGRPAGGHIGFDEPRRVRG